MSEVFIDVNIGLINQAAWQVNVRNGCAAKGGNGECASASASAYVCKW